MSYFANNKFIICITKPRACFISVGNIHSCFRGKDRNFQTTENHQPGKTVQGNSFTQSTFIEGFPKSNIGSNGMAVGIPAVHRVDVGGNGKQGKHQ